VHSSLLCQERFHGLHGMAFRISGSGALAVFICMTAAVAETAEPVHVMMNAEEEEKADEGFQEEEVEDEASVLNTRVRQVTSYLDDITSALQANIHVNVGDREEHSDDEDEAMEGDNGKIVDENETMHGFGKCDFNHSIWSNYSKAPQQGELRFEGNRRGQGLGNVLGGLARAVQLAMATNRHLTVDFDIGDVPFEDVAPMRKGGPIMSTDSAGDLLNGLMPLPSASDGCSYSASAFNFGSSTPLEDLFSAAHNAGKFPVFCLAGNFGLNDWRDRLVAELGVRKSSVDSKPGCALNFALDATKSRKLVKPWPDTFQLVGHLRLGDVHMQGGGDNSDSGRRVLTNIFHDPGRAGVGFVECMQGVAQQLMVQEGRRHCQLVFLSDSQQAKSEAALHANKSGPCPVFIDERSVARHSATQTFGQSEALSTIGELLMLATSDAALLSQSGFGLAGASMGPILSGKAFLIEDFVKGSVSSIKDLSDFCRQSKLIPM